MKKQAGIWIDHKDAYIVFVEEGAHEKDRDAGGTKHVHYAGHGAAHEGAADDQRQRQATAHLGKYYDEVITHLHEAEAILVFGPSEAKHEFHKHLVAKGMASKVVGVEAADKMTEHQIAAKVRKHYEA